MPQAGRLLLSDGSSIEAANARLIETPACGMYLRVDRTTHLYPDDGPAVAVEPGLYQVIRTQG